MEFIQKKNLGFEKENLLYTFTPGFNNDAIRNELLKNSNIINVGASGFQLDNIVWDQKIRDWSGRLSDEEVSVNIIEVGYHFLETYKMQMADGRYYSEEFATDKTDAIIVNEAAVRAMNMKYPIGKTMNLFGNSQTIIGVVKNFNFESLHSKIEPIALVLYPKQLRCLSIRLKSENIIETINYIKRVLTKSYPDYVFEYHFLDQKIDELYKAENQRAELFSTFSFISIFISCLGLFGLASFTAERKTKEIGIRKVLGATVPSIISMLSKDFIKWILATNLIAWPVAYYFMNKWLQDFAYRIEMSWWMFALAGGIALVIALITVSWQAIKAATANPVESLRYE
jgi:putative ABC transport system permease protein